MKNFIKKLRERPEHERKRIAFLLSVFFTAVVVFIWLSSILSAGVTDTSTAREGENLLASSSISPFAEIKNLFSESAEQLGSIWDSFQDNFSEMKNEFLKEKNILPLEQSIESSSSTPEIKVLEKETDGQNKTNQIPTDSFKNLPEGWQISK